MFRTAPDQPWQSLGVILADLDFQPQQISMTGASNDDKFNSVILDLDYLASPQAGTEIFGDNRDNDFNQIIDDGADASHFVLNRVSRLAMNDGTPNPSDATFQNHYTYQDLLGKILNAINAGSEVRILGETDSEIIGRMGIYIEDEASKVNINQAGGLTYVANKRDSFGNDFGFAPMVRSSLTGGDTSQYDLRSLNQIGNNFSERIWNVRMGSILRGEDPVTGDLRNGSGLSVEGITNSFDRTVPDIENKYGNYAYDVSFPGYGFVDDNGSALWMATNGIDDDGDAYWYQNDGIDNDRNGLIDDAGEGVDEGLIPYVMQLSPTLVEAYPTLEGIDEPQEFQQYRPYRNVIAEQNLDNPTFPNFNNSDANNNDNDSDGAIDEIGELGDRPYRTTDQLRLVNGIGATTVNNDLAPFVTAHSADVNLSRSYKSGNSWEDAPTRTPTGVKLDINFASPEEILRALQRNFTYDKSVPRIVDAFGENASRDVTEEALAFASGLRQEDTTVVSATEILELAAGTLVQDNTTPIFEQIQFPSDPELRAHQLAVTAKDFSDSNFSRSTLTLTADDEWLNWLEDGNRETGGHTLTYTQAGVEAIRINEIMVRPVRRIEAETTTLLTDFRYNEEYDPNRYFDDGSGDDDFAVFTRTMVDELKSNSSVFMDPDPGTGDYWTVQEGPVASSNLPVMGLRTAWATYQTYIGFVFDNGVVDPIQIEVPNLIEFRIQASDQVPAGRYYLTMNTQVVSHGGDPSANEHDIANSVFSNQDFIYYTRTGDANNGVIEVLTDQIIDAALGNPLLIPSDDILTTVQSPAALGRDGFNNLTGMAFMQSHDIYSGFTVEVPAAPDFLYVAVARNRPDPEPGNINTTTPLAINYFDLSQEPDHEYVELVNVSDSEQPIDLSGWKLKVEGDNGIEMTIPEDTFIAPGGYLLLGSNKFDYLTAVARSLDTYNSLPLNFARPALNTIYANGMGLARGEVATATDIVGIDTTDWFVNTTVPTTFGSLDPIVESVFERVAGTFQDQDFIDNDGDGRIDNFAYLVSSGTLGGPPDLEVPDDFVISTVDESRYFGHSLGLTGERKAWDRIVELDIPVLEQLDSIGAIGRFVLNGGLFPNYPEQDGIDNDGDNLTLAFDRYDNDGDGFINEVQEGIDEGRFRLHPGNINIESVYVGGYDLFQIPLFMQNPGTLLNEFVDYPVLDPTEINPNIPAPFDPPAWKKLVEERMFPGDNVIVTLYEGSRYNESVLGRDAEDRIVDRVTYTELDVIDRSRDDIINVPDELTFTQRNNDLPSLWPANTMGIDFYKSLERKHPLYNGDKHGTTNRNEATDGNYDDWADAPNYNVRQVELDNFGPFSFNGISGPGGTLRQISGTNGDVYKRLFNHTLFGSPLRMNMAQRKIENPPIHPNIDAHIITEFTRPGQFDFWTVGDIQGTTLDRQLVFPLVSHRNRALVSPADLMTMPHYDRIEEIRAVNQSGFAMDLSGINQRIAFRDSGGNLITESSNADSTVRQVMLGQTFGNLQWDELFGIGGTYFSVDYRIRDNVGELVGVDGAFSPNFMINPTDPDRSNDLSNDLIQLIGNIAVSDSLSLSVATADVVPFGNELDWDLRTTDVMDWDAAYLFPLIGENIVDAPYVFTDVLSTVDTVIPNTVDSRRWPLERRAIAYASRNVAGFIPATDTGREAVFIWDGNDGVENGEYDLYIGVNEDLRPIMQSHQANSILTLDVGNAFSGEQFVGTALRTDASQMKMDINVYTDRDGDGRVWSDSSAIPPDSANLNSTSTAVGVNESFGVIQNATPDRNGFINYGAVTVENNYLAILIENKADGSVLNRVSRIVLAPRTRTPGRININTVETQIIPESTPRYFNPLIGVPGIQFGYNEFDQTFGQGLIADPAPTTNPGGFIPQPNFFDSSNVVRPSVVQDNNDYIHYRAQKIVEARDSRNNIHPDGRYYESIADLVRPVIAADDETEIREEYPAILSDLIRDNYSTPRGNEEAPRFQEIQERFSRMANMITTRSDVFKIYVTVQTGYVSDINNDGILNYRDDNEFTVTSEQRATTIYER